jgi:hypothetical protein
LVIVAILCSTFLGCRDLTPIRVDREPVTLRDAATGDGASPDQSCQACLFAPIDSGMKCANIFDTCYANPLCEKLITCMLESGCFEGFGGEDGNRCGVPCALSAGVVSATDPAVNLGIEVAGCAYTVCPGLCFRDPPTQ